MSSVTPPTVNSTNRGEARVKQHPVFTWWREISLSVEIAHSRSVFQRLMERCGGETELYSHVEEIYFDAKLFVVLNVFGIYQL